MKKIEISQPELQTILEQQDLGPEKVTNILNALDPYAIEKEQKFTVINVLRYLGGMMALLAFGYFFSVAWTIHPSVFLCMLLVTGILTLVLSNRWRHTKPVSSRLMTLITYGVFSASVWTFFHIMQWLDYTNRYGQPDMRGFHHWISGGWFYFETIVLLLGVIMFYCTRVALLTMPIALLVWYMGMDFADLVGFGSFHAKSNITLVFALVLLGLGLWADVRNREKVRTIDDYGFWFSFFGAIGFTASISFTGNNSLIGFMMYFSIHTIMMIFGAFWRRKIFTVVGSIALFMVVSEKFIRIFGWPSIAILGILTLLFADYLHKHREQWMQIVFSKLPKVVVDTIKLRQMYA